MWFSDPHEELTDDANSEMAFLFRLLNKAAVGNDKFGQEGEWRVPLKLKSCGTFLKVFFSKPKLIISCAFKTPGLYLL